MKVSLKERGGSACLYFPFADKETALTNEAFHIQHYGGQQSMGGTLKNIRNSPGLRW